MSIAESPALEKLPTHLDLPETDGKPVENSFEHPQSALLSDVLLPVLSRLHPDENYFVGADTGIYWAHTKPDPLEGCKSPDWYYVPNVSRLRDGILRRSYVMWNEGVRPLIVFEYVSDDGANERDTTPHTGKFWVYERGICATYYAIWDVPRSTLEVYELVRGNYQLLQPDSHGRYWIPEMEVSFGIWHGEYHGYDTEWLRAWDQSGELLPTASELGEQHRLRANAERQRAEVEKQRAEAEKQRAEVEKQRAEKLAAKLREIGIDPDSV
jgi:Uma2 family endonuclease